MAHVFDIELWKIGQDIIQVDILVDESVHRFRKNRNRHHENENEKKNKVDIDEFRVFRGTQSIHSSFSRTYRSPVIERENVIVNPASGTNRFSGKTVVWTLEEYQKKAAHKPAVDYTSLISN